MGSAHAMVHALHSRFLAITVESRAMRAFSRKMALESARIIRALVRYRGNPVRTALRYWQLYRYRRFSPDEIHFLKLLDPALSARELAQVVSKEELLAIQSRLNPPHLHTLTDDKIRFHAHCLASGLPVPKTYAVYDQHDSTHRILPTLRGLPCVESFMRDAPATAFIVKPVDGVHGDGVVRLTRDAAAWHNNRGEVVTPQWLVMHMDGSDYTRWMFQELVRGHSDLGELSGTDALQTVRVVTSVDQAGDAKILAARLRLICGNKAHDNFNYGRTGNLIANLDVRTGVVQSVVGGSPERTEMVAMTRHPITGRELTGFRVPQWDAAQSLVLAAAKAFLPLQAIGWDVAITPNEPCLIEANATWDTFSGERSMGEIYRYLQTLSAPAFE